MQTSDKGLKYVLVYEDDYPGDLPQIHFLFNRHDSIFYIPDLTKVDLDRDCMSRFLCVNLIRKLDCNKNGDG